MERLHSSLVNQEMNPTTALQDSIARVAYNNNVRAKRVKSEDLSKISYTRMLEIYGERFRNAGDFEFYFVGDLCADSVGDLLGKYLGALPVEKKREKYKTVDHVLTEGVHTCIFEKVQDTPSANINFVYHASLKENLRNEILTSMLQQAMQMLYTETVREDEGGAYSIPVRANLRDYPKQQVSVQISLGTSPEKADRMMEVIEEGVEKMCVEGPSEETMQKIREYMLRSHAENLKRNAYWMGALYNRTRLKYDFVTDYEKTVEQMDAEDVRKLACQVFRSGNRIIVGMKTPQVKP